jgi:excinuclease UvrABC ATPase subunit
VEKKDIAEFERNICILRSYYDEFEGVIPSLQAWFEKTDSTWIKEWLHTYMGEKSCATCNGDRLRIEALHVLLDSSHAADAEKATSTTADMIAGKYQTIGQFMTPSTVCWPDHFPARMPPMNMPTPRVTNAMNP